MQVFERASSEAFFIGQAGRRLFPERFLAGAVDSGNEDGAGGFVDGVMHQVGELRHLGTADVFIPKGGKMRVLFDGGQGQLHLTGETFAEAFLLPVLAKRRESRKMGRRSCIARYVGSTNR